MRGREKTVEKITDKTFIPLWLAVVVIGGGAAWLTTLQIAVADSAEKLAKQEIAMNQVSKDALEIKLALARIEEQMKFIVSMKRNSNKRGE